MAASQVEPSGELDHAMILTRLRGLRLCNRAKLWCKLNKPLYVVVPEFYY